MSPLDEERCRLEEELRAAEDALDDAIVNDKGDPEAARRRIDEAQERLDAWGRQVIQIIPAPVGMVAAFARRDGMETHIPVAYLALHRSGKVHPYIFTGNCEAELPHQHPNFLRIDHHWMTNGELSMEDVAHEVVAKSRGEYRWFG